MKNLIFILALCFGFASCQKEDLNQIKKDSTKEKTLQIRKDNTKENNTPSISEDLTAEILVNDIQIYLLFGDETDSLELDGTINFYVGSVLKTSIDASTLDLIIENGRKKVTLSFTCTNDEFRNADGWFKFELNDNSSVIGFMECRPVINGKNGRLMSGDLLREPAFTKLGINFNSYFNEFWATPPTPTTLPNQVE